jgi:hypothetical protein
VHVARFPSLVTAKKRGLYSLLTAPPPYRDTANGQPLRRGLGLTIISRHTQSCNCHRRKSSKCKSRLSMAKNEKSRLRLRWWKSENDSSYSLLHYRCPSDSSSSLCLSILGASRRITWHHHLAFSSSSHSSGIIKYHWTCITLDSLHCFIHPLYFILFLLLCLLVAFMCFFSQRPLACPSPPTSTTSYYPQSHR